MLNLFLTLLCAFHKDYLFIKIIDFKVDLIYFNHVVLMSNKLSRIHLDIPIPDNWLHTVNTNIILVMAFNHLANLKIIFIKKNMHPAFALIHILKGDLQEKALNMLTTHA